MINNLAIAIALLSFVISSCSNRDEIKETKNIETMSKNYPIRITLVQVNNADWNFEKQAENVSLLLDKLEPNSTDLIVLPEMCPGRVDLIQRESVRLKAFIVAGVSQRTSDSTFKNKAVVISPEGNIVTEYTKIFLHDEELRSGYISGD